MRTQLHVELRWWTTMARSHKYEWGKESIYTLEGSRRAVTTSDSVRQGKTVFVRARSRHRAEASQTKESVQLRSHDNQVYRASRATTNLARRAIAQRGLATTLRAFEATYLKHVGEAGQDLVLEEDCSMTVGLEVHAHVVLLRLVVDELDPSLGHRHRHALRLQVPVDGRTEKSTQM